MDYKYKTSINGGPWEEYEYCPTKKAEEIIQELERLDSRISCSCNLHLPDVWDNMSPMERSKFFKDKEVDVVVDSAFCQGDTCTDDDLWSLVKFQDISRLHILGNAITINGVRVITQLPRLTGLLIYGMQYDDDIVPIVLSVKSLQSLDLQKTRISKDACDRIKRAYGEDVELWLPY